MRFACRCHGRHICGAGTVLLVVVLEEHSNFQFPYLRCIIKTLSAEALFDVGGVGVVVCLLLSTSPFTSPVVNTKFSKEW